MIRITEMKNTQIDKNKYGYSSRINGIDVFAGKYEIWVGTDGGYVSVPMEDVHTVIDAMRNANRYAECA